MIRFTLTLLLTLLALPALAAQSMVCVFESPNPDPEHFYPYRILCHPQNDRHIENFGPEIDRVLVDAWGVQGSGFQRKVWFDLSTTDHPGMVEVTLVQDGGPGKADVSTWSAAEGSTGAKRLTVLLPEEPDNFQQIEVVVIWWRTAPHDGHFKQLMVYGTKEYAAPGENYWDSETHDGFRWSAWAGVPFWGQGKW